MKSIRLLLLLGFVSVLIGCGAAQGSSTPQFATSEDPHPQQITVPPDAAEGNPAFYQRELADQSATAGSQGAAGGEAQAQSERLVIKTANLSLQVENVRDAEFAIRAKVAELNGYIVNMATNGIDDQMTVQITIRVPAAQFDAAMEGVQGLAKKVLSRTISGDDVTEEFVDLESRLRNLEATRDRLLGFLDKASKVEDALSVNTALNDVQGQIEQIRGRMQYLKQSAALSTITIALLPVPITPIIEEGAWQPVEVARSALRELVTFGQGLANIIIILLVWTPVWLPLVLGALWVRRRVLCAFTKSKPDAAQAA